MNKAPKIYRALYFQVLVAVVLGISVGHVWPEFGASLKPLGDGFVKLIKMMIAPIVFCTIALGIANMSDMKGVARTMGKAMGLFYVLTLIALMTGLVAVYLIQPGVGMNIDPAMLDAGVVSKFSKAGAPTGFVAFVMHIIPTTFFGAFAEGEVLPVLLLAILVGFGLSRVGAAAKPVHVAIDAFSHVLFAIFGFLMKLAPLAAFGAMAFTVGKYGVASISSLGTLMGTFYAACLFFVFVVLGTLARLHGFSLWKGRPASSPLSCTSSLLPSSAPLPKARCFPCCCSPSWSALACPGSASLRNPCMSPSTPSRTSCSRSSAS